MHLYAFDCALDGANKCIAGAVMKEKLVSFYIKTFSLPLYCYYYTFNCSGVEKSGSTTYPKISETLGTIVVLTSAT